MEKITMKINPKDYPEILKRYGAEGARRQAIHMVITQKLEMTAENLYSALSTLESDMAGMFA
jgi:hypothetical protein